jgi:hypothetical protein
LTLPVERIDFLAKSQSFYRPLKKFYEELIPMKKSVWLVLALLALAVFTPAAHADTYTYTFTGAGTVSGTDFTLVDTAGPLGFSTTANDIGFVTTATDEFMFGIDYGAIGQIFLYLDDGNGAIAIYAPRGGFGGTLTNLTDLGVDGTYSLGPGDGTLTISSTPSTTVAPEPGSIALVLAGAGLLGLLAVRKQAA